MARKFARRSCKIVTLQFPPTHYHCHNKYDKKHNSTRFQRIRNVIFWYSNAYTTYNRLSIIFINSTKFEVIFFEKKKTFRLQFMST